MKNETVLAIIGVVVVVFLLLMGMKSEDLVPPKRKVVVYVSEDKVFSRPVLDAFEKKTGIEVEAVYDTEESKSTGVMNRLIAERERPRADVYWANEPVRAEVLRQKGLLEPYVSKNAEGIPARFKDPDGYWCGFSARARVLVVRRRVKNPPASVFDYADPRWKDRTVIANPLFGTTTTHMAALFVTLGDDRAEAFMRAMKDNGVTMSTSNGESAELVGRGHFDFALVDSDDAVSRIRQGQPVTMVYPDQNGTGVFIVPNAAMLIKNAPHPAEAKRLIDYLLSKETERRLAFADCAQIPLHEGVPTPRELTPIGKLRTMRVDYAEVAKKMIAIQPFLRQWAGL